MEGIFNKLLKGIGDTVDFELPEWLNKWKPTTYTFIKRSILSFSILTFCYRVCLHF